MKTQITIILSLVLLLASCLKPVKETGKSEFAEVSEVDSGRAVTVILTTYSTTLIANGEDHTSLRVAVIDSVGREIRSANNEIQIYIDGDVTVTGTREGEDLITKVDTAGKEYLEYHLNKGLSWFVLQAGNDPGKAKVEVRSPGLWPGSHEIHTIPADVELKSPSRNQLKAGNIQIDKMIGADISFLPQFEERGMKFLENGVETDAIKILNKHGFNYIRLRIFVNPENKRGYSPESGFCDLDHTLQMASRLKAAGMKLLINFHYSDYWADPQQQNKPAAWADMDFNSLKNAMKKYTVKVLEALEDQGTPADMVQVGNEINHGLLWPEGHISQLDQLTGLLKAGTEAVRSVNPELPVMMHLALGGQNKEAVFWFDNMIARGLDFDIMGISFYPRWHGTLDDLKYNLNDLIKRYKKPVNVVEYGNFAKEIHEIVFSLPGDMGKGTCIWEPLGFRGNLFDREGEVSNGLFLYDDLRDKYLKSK